jgi:hypothetical protein
MGRNCNLCMISYYKIEDGCIRHSVLTVHRRGTKQTQKNHSRRERRLPWVDHEYNDASQRVVTMRSGKSDGE